MASCEITIEVRTGPTLRATLRVAKYAREIGELVPEWHGAERDELRRRLRKLARAIRRELQPEKRL